MSPFAPESSGRAVFMSIIVGSETPDASLDSEAGPGEKRGTFLTRKAKSLPERLSGHPLRKGHVERHRRSQDKVLPSQRLDGTSPVDTLVLDSPEP